MKKLIGLALLAAGAAYILTKKKNVVTEDDEEIKIVKIEEETEEPIFIQPETFEEIKEDIQPEVFVEESVFIEPEQPEEENHFAADSANMDNAYYNIKYPYLKHGFILETLEYASNFTVDYPNGTALKLTHIVKFEEVELLIEYVKMVKENDYFIQEGEEDNSILASKDLVTQDDNLLEEILHNANQVSNIGGEYSGFQIDKKLS